MSESGRFTVKMPDYAHGADAEELSARGLLAKMRDDEVLGRREFKAPAPFEAIAVYQFYFSEAGVALR
jgi:hypothetical protein